MFRIALLLLGLMLALSAPANASDATGTFGVLGYGTKSCGAYLQDRRQGDFYWLPYSHWLGGFITGINHERAGTFDIAGNTDIAGLIGWLDNYCSSNPTASFVKAADALVIFLHPNRMQKAPK